MGEQSTQCEDFSVDCCQLIESHFFHKTPDCDDGFVKIVKAIMRAFGNDGGKREGSDLRLDSVPT